MRAAAFAIALLATAQLLTASAAADDGVYGRLDGDLTLSVEAGVSATLGREDVAGEAIAGRLGLFYLHSVGLYGQYNDSLGSDAQPIARSLAGGVELRPLFLGRWAQDMERGPAHLDLWLDSLSIALGSYGSFMRDDYGMEASLGSELPLLPQASTPFIAFRAGLRWSLREPREAVAGMLTLSIGYHHLFQTHLVDAGDVLD